MTEVHGEWKIKPYDGLPEHAFELSYKGTANPNWYISRACVKYFEGFYKTNICKLAGKLALIRF